MAISSVAAIADLVLGRLAEARHVPLHPVGGPFDQLVGVHDGQTEQLDRLRCVGEPRRRLFLAAEYRLAAKLLAEPGRKIAHGEDLVAADIDRRGRRVAMREAAQRLRGCIALPDEVDMAEADVDGLAPKHLAGDVVQHGVSGQADRKSTRLNSSHMSISYAV